MKSSPNLIKIKSKCTHKLSKSPHKPKTTKYQRQNYDNQQLRPISHYTNIKPKQTLLANNQNHNHTNYQLCKQATLCYYGLKEVIKMQTLQKQSKKILEENKKLKEQKCIYEEYFTQFEKRFKQQKEQIKKLKQQNVFLKARNAKIQQLNSTLSGVTVTGRTCSHKQSHMTRSTPKYLF